MDIAGYRKYLESLGDFGKLADREISTLVNIEQTLNVDIDDYIPKGGEYSRVVELEAGMIEKMRYSEDVTSALNRYIGYRLNTSK